MVKTDLSDVKHVHVIEGHVVSVSAEYYPLIPGQEPRMSIPPSRLLIAQYLNLGSNNFATIFRINYRVLLFDVMLMRALFDGTS